MFLMYNTHHVVHLPLILQNQLLDHCSV